MLSVIEQQLYFSGRIFQDAETEEETLENFQKKPVKTHGNKCIMILAYRLSRVNATWQNLQASSSPAANKSSSLSSSSFMVDSL